MSVFSRNETENVAELELVNLRTITFLCYWNYGDDRNRHF